MAITKLQTFNMQRLLLSLLLCILSCKSLAQQPIIMPAVNWHLSFGDIRNGFQYQNQSTREQYVQIAGLSGKSHLFTDTNLGIKCRSVINVDESQFSKICQLPPGASLQVFLGPREYDATGFYQVAMY